MRTQVLHSLLFLIATSLAFPAAPPSPTSTSTAKSDPVFTVTEFSAFIASLGSGADSSAFFYFHDSRPEYRLHTSCHISATEPESIYRNTYTRCGNGKVDLKFKLSEGEVRIRRGWAANKNLYLTGEAPQGTYWKEGEGGNATATDGGMLYTRTTEWAFPVTSLSAS